MRARAIVALAVCAGGLGAACAGGGAGEDGGTGDGRPQDAVIVDEARGTFRGLRLGESAAQVRQRMGPTRCDEEARIAPLGEDYDDIGIPYWGNYQPRDKDGPYTQCEMRYRSLVVSVFLPDGAISPPPWGL